MSGHFSSIFFVANFSFSVFYHHNKVDLNLCELRHRNLKKGEFILAVGKRNEGKLNGHSTDGHGALQNILAWTRVLNLSPHG